MHSLIEGALSGHCPSYDTPEAVHSTIFYNNMNATVSMTAVAASQKQVTLKCLSNWRYTILMLDKCEWELAFCGTPLSYDAVLHTGNSMSGMDTFKTMVTNIFKVKLQPRQCYRAVFL